MLLPWLLLNTAAMSIADDDDDDENQGWESYQQSLYYFSSQGTVLMPIDWFLALPQPNGTGLFSDPSHLGSYGLINVEPSKANPLGLPVGLAVAPQDSPAAGTIGITCAACHTGELRYRGERLRIDGGQAMFNSGQFGSDIGIAILQTWKEPAVFAAFASRVLGASADDAARQQLFAQLGKQVDKILWKAKYAQDLRLYPAIEGYGRSDAIGRIGNSAFAVDLLEPQNFHVANAPVDFPPLWDIWKFDWVQYDASVTQPMSRNVGESLGVGAETNFVDAAGNPVQGPEKWNSSTNFDNLYILEGLLRELKPPSWPEKLFGRVDKKLAESGKKLYSTHCASCHAPRPVKGGDRQYAKLAVTTVPLEVIGTDPQRVLNSASAVFNPFKLTGSSAPIGIAAGLPFVNQQLMNRFYDINNFSARERSIYDGLSRPNLARFELMYKARPLDGIWATAPFLHNGSVRNMYQLLSPANERDITFPVGDNDFDPVLMGLSSQAVNYQVPMDTTKTGNSNFGHEFDNRRDIGVIGPKLTKLERMAIIEYLKVIDRMPPKDLAPVRLDWQEYGWLRQP
jgi:mono/diheme cytochrome c family protein